MREKKVQQKRTESVLKELVADAIGSLNDDNINNLVVTEVVCSRGKYDATVYLNKTDYSEKEQNNALKSLRRAKGFIKSHCLSNSGWYKCPDFTFQFDKDLERMNRIDDLFAQIKDRENKNES